MVEEKNYKDYYNGLIAVIDHWLEEQPDKQEGAFRFLKADTFVRNIILSSLRMINEAKLKTFLDINILYIYEESKSNVTHKAIERYLAGNLGKKYRFDFDFLMDCMDKQKNVEALSADLKSKNKLKQPELIYEVTEEIPYLLLKNLKETAFFYLKQYWKETTKCMETATAANWTMVENEADLKQEDRKMQEFYGMALISVALFEIFSREYLIERGKFMKQDWTKKYEQDIPRLKKLEQKLNGLSKASERGYVSEDETEVSELINEVEWALSMAEKTRNESEKSLIYLEIMQDFYQELYADIMILMLVERGGYVSSEGVDKLFSYYALDNVVTGITMDHNKRKFYKCASEYMNMILKEQQKERTLDTFKDAIDDFLLGNSENGFGRMLLAEPVHSYMVKKLNELSE